MYPRVSDLFSDLFGIPFPVTIYSYGFMLVVAVFGAAWLTGRELDRLYQAGRVSGVKVPGEEEEASGEEAARTVSPSVLVWTLATIAALAGVAGARLFFILENLDEFALDPVGLIFSSGGLTFFGGLIVATGALVWYLQRRKLRLAPFADAMAPGLMLGYGIGRIGCYLAGDGDWGICSTLTGKPGWVPAWLWSEKFEGNILGAPATVIEDCPPAAAGVYPTMLYEFGLAVLIAGVLWAARRHPFQTGWLFSLYLVLSSVERFFIEIIRVTPEYDVLGWTATQAQVIAVVLFAGGVASLAYLSKRRSDVGLRLSPLEAR